MKVRMTGTMTTETGRATMIVTTDRMTGMTKTVTETAGRTTTGRIMGAETIPTVAMVTGTGSRGRVR